MNLINLNFKNFQTVTVVLAITSAFVLTPLPTVQAAQSTSGLSIDLAVRNLTRGGAFQETVFAEGGDRLQFQITIDTGGGNSLGYTNVVVRNLLSSRLAFAGGEQDVISAAGLVLGNLSSGASRVITFDVLVAAGPSATIYNRASVVSREVSEKTDLVTIQVGQADTGQSVKAVNHSTGEDATLTPARPGDVILFQLISRNSASALAVVRAEADIREILDLARLSHTGGAVVDNGVIRFPTVNLSPGGAVTQTFEITVLPSEVITSQARRTMVIVYSNKLTIQVDPTPRTPAVAGTTTAKPPRTGASETLVFVLASLLTLGYWLYRRKARVLVYK